MAAKLFASIVIVIAIALVLLIHFHESKPSLECATVHKPVKADCPTGYVQEKTPRFTERDGSKEFACLSSDPTKEQCTDVLKAGESVTFRLFDLPAEPVEEPAPKPAGEKKL